MEDFDWIGVGGGQGASNSSYHGLQWLDLLLQTAVIKRLWLLEVPCLALALRWELRTSGHKAFGKDLSSLNRVAQAGLKLPR